MFDLKKLWTREMLLADTNDDGVPDQTAVQIYGVSNTCCPEGLVDFTARLGLETSGLSFTFFPSENSPAIKGKDWRVTLGLEDGACSECRLLSQKRMIEILSPSEEELSSFLRWVASSWPYAFAEQEEKFGAIAELAYREGFFRVKDISGQESEWILVDRPATPCEAFSPTFQSLADLWTTDGFYQAKRVDLNSRCNVGFRFEIKPTPQILKQACCLSAKIGLYATGLQFPLTGDCGSKELFFSVNGDSYSPLARIAWQVQKPLDSVEIRVEGGEQAVSNALGYLSAERIYEEGGTFGIWEKEPSPKREESLLLDKTWNDVGEKERLLQEAISWAEEMEPAHTVTLEAFLSEPPEIREEVQAALTDLLKSKAENVRVLVFSAFKPGYHWIEETLLPKLLPLASQIGKIQFFCRKETSENCLELPIRWIQELYPVDRLLAEKLDLSTDDVGFDLAEQQNETYRVTVLSKEGNLLFSKGFTIPTAEAGSIEEGKKCYPTTGFLRLTADGAVVREKTMPTDRERFWKFFTDEVMNQLPKILPVKEKDRGYRYPLFNRMVINLQMSEEERELGIGEERHSSLEALHEDLYFDTLDYFRAYGLRENGSPMTTVGGIQPFLKAVPGIRPEVSVRIYSWKLSEACPARTKVLTFSSEKREPVSCVLSREGRRYSVLSDQWLKKISVSVSGISRPDIKVWLGGISYEGRPIPVVELYSPTDAQFISPHKLSSYKPTIMVEARHHANEVSSTPAIIDLINRLDASLLKKVNLVVLPVANPDGAALHAALAKDNPKWKHHAARFNAVGLEYARQRFQSTIFGESEVVPKIFLRWLPDVSDDDHGVPSHEWIQPFAGYNSPPSFPVSYWIPNSAIYGISKDLAGQDYAKRRETVDYVVSCISKKIAQDKEIEALNREYAASLEKYSTRWLPDLFPIHKSGNMIFLRNNTSPNPDSHEVIARYPEWCCIELISETSDETVYGKALERCVRAHQLFDEALIETVAQVETDRKACWEKGVIRYQRLRPLLFTKNFKKNEFIGKFGKYFDYE